MDIDDFASVKWHSPLKLHKVCRSEDLGPSSSTLFLAGETQLVVFRFTNNKIFACQNMCGHRRAFVLREGTLGLNVDGFVSVSCPIHHRKFALEGPNKGRTTSKKFQHSLATFECHEEDGFVYILLPSANELDTVLGTGIKQTPQPRMVNECSILRKELTW